MSVIDSINTLRTLILVLKVILVDNTVLQIDSKIRFQSNTHSNWTVDPEGGYFSDDYMDSQIKLWIMLKIQV